MGGWIVQELLLEQGPLLNQVKGVILLAPVPPRGIFPYVLGRVVKHPFSAVNFLASGDSMALIGTPALARESLFPLRLNLEVIKNYLEKFQPESTVAGLQLAFRTFGAERTLKQMPVPMFIAGMNQDAIIPKAKLEQFAKAIGRTTNFYNTTHDFRADTTVMHKLISDLITWVQEVPSASSWFEIEKIKSRLFPLKLTNHFFEPFHGIALGHINHAFEDCRGYFIALINAFQTSARLVGWQFALAANIGGNIDGGQVSPYNLVGRLSGWQGGLLNQAIELVSSTVQVGVLNTVGDVAIGGRLKMFGLLNVNLPSVLWHNAFGIWFGVIIKPNFPWENTFSGLQVGIGNLVSRAFGDTIQIGLINIVRSTNKGSKLTQKGLLNINLSASLWKKIRFIYSVTNGLG